MDNPIDPSLTSPVSGSGGNSGTKAPTPPAPVPPPPASPSPDLSDLPDLPLPDLPDKPPSVPPPPPSTDLPDLPDSPNLPGSAGTPPPPTPKTPPPPPPLSHLPDPIPVGPDQTPPPAKPKLPLKTVGIVAAVLFLLVTTGLTATLLIKQQQGGGKPEQTPITTEEPGIDSDAFCEVDCTIGTTCQVAIYTRSQCESCCDNAHGCLQNSGPVLCETGKMNRSQGCGGVQIDCDNGDDPDTACIDWTPCAECSSCDLPTSTPTPLPTPTETPVNTPTPTETPVNTPTPTPTPLPQCYDQCIYDDECPEGLKCRCSSGDDTCQVMEKYCLNLACPEDRDCVCSPTNTPTPPPAGELVCRDLSYSSPSEETNPYYDEDITLTCVTNGDKVSRMRFRYQLNNGSWVDNVIPDATTITGTATGTWSGTTVFNFYQSGIIEKDPTQSYLVTIQCQGCIADTGTDACSAWPCPPEATPTPDQIAICEAGGGVWNEKLPTSCADKCIQEDCRDVETPGCDCQEAKCWDEASQACIPDSSDITDSNRY